MIVVHADAIKVSGPKIDGGYTVTLFIGEYERTNVGRIVGENVPDMTYKVTIEPVAKV